MRKYTLGMAAFLNLKPIEKKCKKKKIKKFGIHSEFRIGCWDVLRKLQIFNYEKRKISVSKWSKRS